MVPKTLQTDRVPSDIPKYIEKYILICLELLDLVKIKF